eukprot:gene2372-4604_t
MPILSLQNINVDFPFEPYSCQVDYMDQVMSALLMKTNALLESPTGTGKTMCLLCSTLAWQNQTKPSLPISLEYNAGPSIPNLSRSNPQNGPSVIVYASRTHSQISQVVSELKATSYRPKMAVLGSREQLCIHDKLSALRGSALNHACNTLSAQRRCMYKNNLDTYNGHIEGIGDARAPIEDIEALMRRGKSDRICPYFFTREASTTAELILLPYNYLLDTSIRVSLKIEWKNAIVIFDEAHNLERVASDSASISISSADIAQCIKELQQVITLLKTFGNNEQNTTATSTSMKMNSADSNGLNRPSMAITARILKALFEIEKRMDSLPLSTSGLGKGPGSVLPGAHLPAMLEAAGFSFTQSFQNMDEIRRCADMILEEAQMALEGASLSPAEPKLVILAKLLSRVFRGKTSQECAVMAADYKVYICEESTTANGTGTGAGTGVKGGTVFRKKRVLNYWCFRVAMEDLHRLGVRSILVTSGTLSPMTAFRDDLKLPFPMMLSNPHVIRDHQLWVGAIAMGPQGKSLNSSYNNRDTPEYK